MAGVGAALALLTRGHDVTVVDRFTTGQAASGRSPSRHKRPLLQRFSRSRFQKAIGWPLLWRRFVPSPPVESR
nr:FAD-dependent oxidoreductase [Tritonibacter litoralis]